MGAEHTWPSVLHRGGAGKGERGAYAGRGLLVLKQTSRTMERLVIQPQNLVGLAAGSLTGQSPFSSLHGGQLHLPSRAVS